MYLKYTFHVGGMPVQTQYITAREVAESLGISKGKAYKIIRQLNEELKNQGYITISGRCSLQYFKEKVYGFGVSQ